jgi:hypothetical protein
VKTGPRVFQWASLCPRTKLLITVLHDSSDHAGKDDRFEKETVYGTFRTLAPHVYHVASCSTQQAYSFMARATHFIFKEYFVHRAYLLAYVLGELLDDVLSAASVFVGKPWKL